MTNVIMGMQFLERVCFRISRAEVCSILLTLGVLRIPVPVHSRSYGRGKKKKKNFFSFWAGCRMLVILIKRKLPSDPGRFLLVT